MVEMTEDRASRIDDPGVAAIVDEFVTECAGDVVVVTEVGGHLRWISPSAKRLMGWDGSDVSGRRTSEFIHEDDLERTLELRGSTEEGHVLIRIRRADGSYLWCRVLSRPILDEAGEYVGRVSIFRDVHVEVESRRKLAESEEWYRLLVENVTDFVTMASPDGRFTWASPS